MQNESEIPSEVMAEASPDAGPSAPEAPAPAPAPAPEAPARKPFEAWARAKKTPKWLLAAATAGERWPVGREVTEVEFDAATARAAGGTSR
jgi:hypothetical protein